LIPFSIARATSSTPALGTVSINSPVAGFRISIALFVDVSPDAFAFDIFNLLLSSLNATWGRVPIDL
jgi:hypothetical protein